MDTHRDLDKPLKGLRIGLPREFFGAGMDDDVRASIEQALDQYRQLGATTVEVGLPNSGLSVPAYYVIAPAEASSNLSRFDGVRYGHRAEKYDDLLDMYKKSRAEGFGAEVKRRIMLGTYALSAGYYDAYYGKALKVRRLIAQAFDKAYEQFDLLLSPTGPTTAFELGAKSADPLAMYLMDVCTIPTNLAGHPAMNVPYGSGSDGLPVGVQVLGPVLSEPTMFRAAQVLESSLG